jgi:hypothetical protein
VRGDAALCLMGVRPTKWDESRPKHCGAGWQPAADWESACRHAQRIFNGLRWTFDVQTSGLVEQQAWFARLRAAKRPRMTPLLEAARDLQTFLEERHWRFAIIGGLALLRWREPRFTRDVDVSLLCGFGREDEFIPPFFASGYRPRISDAAAFARRNRVLLLEAPDGVPIDIALAGLPFEEEVVECSSKFEFAAGCSLRTCSAEDLIVFKLFAFRLRDSAHGRLFESIKGSNLADVESVVTRRESELDWDYIERQLRH